MFHSLFSVCVFPYVNVANDNNQYMSALFKKTYMCALFLKNPYID